MMINKSLLAILVVALVGYAALSIKSCHERQRLSGIIQATQDTVRTWQDDAGRWRAEATAARVTNSEMRKFFHQETEQIRKDFDIRLKNVTAYIRSATTTGQTIIMPRDSTSTIIVNNANGSDTASFAYSDRWANINARLDSRNLSVSYLVRDSLAFVTSWKSTGFLRPKQLRVDGISYNPNTRITGLDNIAVKTLAPRWSAGIFAGYGITPGLSPGWVAGVGLQYRLISW